MKTTKIVLLSIILIHCFFSVFLQNWYAFSAWVCYLIFALSIALDENK